MVREKALSTAYNHELADIPCCIFDFFFIIRGTYCNRSLNQICAEPEPEPEPDQSHHHCVKEMLR